MDSAVSEIVYSKPIPISEFTKYVAELHTDMNQPFQDLFQVSFDTMSARAMGQPIQSRLIYFQLHGGIVDF